ncbi:MAG: biotin--[acetyl-CoA-carboxylase] ligase [Hyphomonadaceae bacterium]
MIQSLWPAHWLEEIDSTNEEAKRIARAGHFSDQWIAAKAQTAGRGRAGRAWVSPAGNLYTTALFSWSGSISEATRIPFVAALSVSDVVAQLAPQSAPKLKWPNDVRCHGAKISGTLIETGEHAIGRWIAAGIGVNIVHAPEGLDQDTTSIADLRGDLLVDAQAVLDALRSAFAMRLSQAIEDFAITRQAWLERADGLGETVHIKCDDTIVEGIFADMDETGALLLRLPNGSIKTIRTGDVHLIKEVVD